MEISCENGGTFVTLPDEFKPVVRRTEVEEKNFAMQIIINKSLKAAYDFYLKIIC